MRVSPHCQDGVAVLDVTGDVRPDEAGALVGAVEQAVAGTPRGVVLDLRDVTSLAAEAVTALARLTRSARPWPWPSLLLCTSSPVPDLPAYPDPDEALRHVDDRSSAPRQRVELPHGPQGPGCARDVVTAWADRVGLPELRDDLALLVSEMVTNAVRHAAAPVSLEVEGDGETVLIAVSDGSARAPLARDADADAEGGRGLLLVDLLSSAHGVRPEATGKTVWAAVTRAGALPGA